MIDVLAGLFDTAGFTPRKDGGTGWTAPLIWLHVTSDLFIWLAYSSIPLVLLYFSRRRDLPLSRPFVLFAIFFLACGTTHLIDAIGFEYPIDRIAGAVKLFTALAAWATVIALVPVVPRVMNAVHAASQPGADTQFHRPLPSGLSARLGRVRDYTIAVLAGVVAILVRALIDPVLIDDHIFVVALLAVVYVSWQSGFGPGIACLIVGVGGYMYLFVPPRNSFFIVGLGNQLAVALFFFCGVACAALGESQRAAHRRARRAVVGAEQRRDELEAEVGRRRVIEAALRERESELLAAQRETAEALARLNAFLDNAPLGIAFLDPDLTYQRVNPFLAEATGLPIEEQLGRKLPEVLPEFPPEFFDEYRRTASAAGKPITTQIRRSNDKHPSDERVWEITAFPVRSDDDRTLGAGVVVQDVTESLKAVQELRRSEEQFRTLAETIPHLAWMMDSEGYIFWYNQRWYDYTGTALEQMQGWGWQSVHDPAELPRVLAKFKAHIASGEPWEDTFPLRGRDGEYRWHLSRARPMRDATGAIFRWFGTNTDISDQRELERTLARMVGERTAELLDSNAALISEVDDRKAAEQQVRAVAAELKRSNDELEKFAYVASHDLQEPLRKIQTFGDRLRERCRAELPEFGQEYVDRMLSASGRMRRLIDDLLTFSRVTSQQKPFRPVDLGKLVREVASDLDVRIGQFGGTVRVGPLAEIDADPSQMRQLFQNLIANAVKFHRPGVAPVVEIESELVSETTGDPGFDPPIPMCRVSVRDNGIGFDEKYRDRIFEVFQRLSGRSEYEGTGVGLAICRKIVERHGGAITARSREGEGSTFVVTLPVRHSNAQESTESDE